MLSPIQKAKRKKRYTSTSALRNLISADTYFEFQTPYSLTWCMEYLEREIKLSDYRSYGPFVENPKSETIRPDIVTFSLCVKFDERRKSEGLAINGSLEGLNDGSTVIRGKVTNGNWGLQLIPIVIAALFYIAIFTYVEASPLWFLSGLIIVVVTLAYNSSTKRQGLQYIEALLSPL